MVDTWSEYIFVTLMICSFIAAWASGDNRIRAGFLVLFGAWVASLAGVELVGLHASVYKEIFISAIVIITFFQIADATGNRERFGAWPNAILMIECIFLVGTVAKNFGDWYYLWVLNTLFAVELLVLIIASCPKAYDRLSNLNWPPNR